MSSNGKHVMEVRLVPEIGGDGNVARVLGISRDVSSRHQAEEERLRLQQQLEETRRAVSASRLGTTVAHEFNNVLMSISPFAEIIARTDKENERLQKAAAHIRNAIARGRRVTQDIMRFTRPAAPALRTIELATWLPAIVQSLQDASVGMTVHVPARPLYADVDPQQLEQVVANLVLNAREALADSGGSEIEVRLTSSDDSIRLTVRDDGPGIAPENLDKLFEPFFTTKRKGTGLGLPVVRQIVERHHGTVEVESHGNAGTTFVVTLPPAAAPPARRDVEVEQTIRGRQVLLVEDEIAVAEGMVALLQEGAAEVRVAPTGLSAVVALEQQLPEAVLLDVGLPDIDGVDLFSLLRKRWPGLPIVFSTGHGDQARLDEMLRLPHVGHLVKAFDLDELTVAVANAIAE
jgi:nitrogen-specific signal transduction histidine kinase